MEATVITLSRKTCLADLRTKQSTKTGMELLFSLPLLLVCEVCYHARHLGCTACDVNWITFLVYNADMNQICLCCNA
jgi:hypothetical protein